MSCMYVYGSDQNSRSFTFTYIVDLESSNGKKLELWVPLPQSNEVQSISNLNIKAEGLSFEVKDEKTHGNKYVYSEYISLVFLTLKIWLINGTVFCPTAIVNGRILST